MLKKRLSILAFAAAVIISISIMLCHSKIETPYQHAENAAKITQIADKGKAKTKTKEVPLSADSKKGEGNAKQQQTADKNTTVVNKDTTENKEVKTENKDGSNQKIEITDASKADKSLVQTPTSGVNTTDSNYAALVDNANHHTNSNKKDKYLTDPTPAGMPTPVEPQNVTIDSNSANYCTLSIRCDTILNNKDKLHKNKECMVPGNGVIYDTKQVVYYKGESVFNVLVRETAKNRIQMDFENTPIYNSAYIKGIHNLYEFDCGSLSGWMYKVNGWFPNYGCSRYLVKPGDKIEWVYTCDLGRDVGCIWMGDK